MMNAWDVKTEDVRTSDSLYTFVIFCEDEISEYYYFKWFETRLIKVNVIKKQKSMLANVRNAIYYCTEKGILEFNGRDYVIENEGIEIWCVYDRDSEKDPVHEQQSNNEFNLSVSIAANSNINIAWSNDAFELWVLLHLMDIDHTIEASTKRVYYYERLTEYFKNKPNPNSDLAKALIHSSFSYKKDLKHKTNFINIVREEILPYTFTAIERSKLLVKLHETKINHYEKKPCTLVHNLVISLLEKGKKQLPSLSS